MAHWTKPPTNAAPSRTASATGRNAKSFDVGSSSEIDRAAAALDRLRFAQAGFSRDATGTSSRPRSRGEMHCFASRGASSAMRAGRPSTSPPVTARLSGENSVCESGIAPPSGIVASTLAGTTFAAPSAVVIESGADPEKPPCQTSIAR